MNACPAAPEIAVKGKAKDGFADYKQTTKRKQQETPKPLRDPEYCSRSRCSEPMLTVTPDCVQTPVLDYGEPIGLYPQSSIRLQ
jgi:hypothetical protein